MSYTCEIELRGLSRQVERLESNARDTNTILRAIDERLRSEIERKARRRDHFLTWGPIYMIWICIIVVWCLPERPPKEKPTITYPSTPSPPAVELPGKPGAMRR